MDPLVPSLTRQVASSHQVQLYFNQKWFFQNFEIITVNRTGTCAEGRPSTSNLQRVFCFAKTHSLFVFQCNCPVSLVHHGEFNQKGIHFILFIRLFRLLTFNTTQDHRPHRTQSSCESSRSKSLIHSLKTRRISSSCFYFVTRI